MVLLKSGGKVEATYGEGAKNEIEWANAGKPNGTLSNKLIRPFLYNSSFHGFNFYFILAFPTQ